MSTLRCDLLTLLKELVRIGKRCSINIAPLAGLKMPVETWITKTK
jgi:hypothetical protein